MTRMFFEEFNVAGLAFVDSAVCAVYASGRVSGVSVDVAEQGTDAAARGRTARRRRRPRGRIEVGGRAMDEALMRCVEKKQCIDLDADVASVIRRESGSVRPRARNTKLARGCPTVECESKRRLRCRMDPC